MQILLRILGSMTIMIGIPLWAIHANGLRGGAPLYPMKKATAALLPFIIPDGLGFNRNRNSLVVSQQQGTNRQPACRTSRTARKQAEESLRQLNETLEQRVAERTELAEARSRQLQALAMELIEAEERERRRIVGLCFDIFKQRGVVEAG